MGIQRSEFFVACHLTMSISCVYVFGVRCVYYFFGISVPQLSMHSCREMMATADLSYGVKLFKAFYEKFRHIDDNLCREIKK